MEPGVVRLYRGGLPRGVTTQGSALRGEHGTHPAGPGARLLPPARTKSPPGEPLPRCGLGLLWDLHPEIKPPWAGCRGGGRPKVRVPSPESSHTCFPPSFIAASSSFERCETPVQRSGANGVPEPAGFGTGWRGDGDGGASSGVLPRWRRVTG